MEKVPFVYYCTICTIASSTPTVILLKVLYLCYNLL